MRVVGIDPGVDGGIALLTRLGDLVDAVDTPTVTVGALREVSAHGVAALLKQWGPGLAIIEAVRARPGEGANRSWSFGRGCGVLEGVCAALDIEVVHAHPATWKRAMKVTSDKQTSLAMVKRMWPERAGLFERVRDNGRAEAALVGFYGRASGRK